MTELNRYKALAGIIIGLATLALVPALSGTSDRLRDSTPTAWVYLPLAMRAPTPTATPTPIPTPTPDPLFPWVTPCTETIYVPYPDGSGWGGYECVITDPPTHFDTGLVVGEAVWHGPGELPSHPINVHIRLDRNPARRGERQGLEIGPVPPDWGCYTAEVDIFYPGGQTGSWAHLGYEWPIPPSVAPGLAVAQITLKRWYPCGSFSGYRVWRMAVGFNVE